MRTRVVVGVSLALVLAQACVDAEHEDGIRIDVTLGHAHGGSAWLAAGDAQVELDAAFVTVTELELLPCAPVASWPWREALGGVAWAHGRGSRTKLAVPIVEDLLAPEGDDRLVGTLAAPPGRYCGVRVTLGPADADAVDLPALTDMVGHSARFRGEVVDAAGARALDARCDTLRQLDVSLPPFEVGAAMRSASARVVLDATALFDGLDVDGDDVACAALANLR